VCNRLLKEATGASAGVCTVQIDVQLKCAFLQSFSQKVWNAFDGCLWGFPVLSCMLNLASVLLPTDTCATQDVCAAV
jgi:hypothetical protein